MNLMEKRTNNIIVSESDFDSLTELIETFRVVDPELIKCQQLLNDKLKDARIIEDKEVPKGLAQLNSIITVKTSFGRKVGLELVLPKDADFHDRKLSVISSLGTALFGIKEGEKTIWHFPNGDEWIVIEEVDNSLIRIANETAI